MIKTKSSILSDKSCPNWMDYFQITQIDYFQCVYYRYLTRLKINRLMGAFSFEEMGKLSFLPRRKRPGEFLLKQLRLGATYDGEAAEFILHLAMFCS